MALKRRGTTNSLKNQMTNGIIAILAAVGDGCLEAITDPIKNNFGPALVEVRNVFEDRFTPLPQSVLIGVNLAFYMLSAKAGEASTEVVSATIPGALCLEPNGYKIVRAFDELAET